MGNQRIEPVSPSLLLSLWRERWRKAGSAAARVPYSEGKLTRWGDQLTDNAVWSVPGAAWVTALCSVALFLLTIDVSFTTSGQIIFSLGLAGAALYFRRYEGMLMTLMLASLSVIASARYFDWRFSSVLNLDYTFTAMLALGLCLAELYFWLVTALGFVTNIWPLKRVSVQLPADKSEWPTVDVFIPVYHESINAAQEATAAALALEWPAKKLAIHLLDDHHRAELTEFATSTGVNYLVLSDAPESKAGRIHLAASQTEGALIAILDCHQPPDPRFLEQTIGWFVEDLKLGMIQTPHHSLAPAVSENCLSICSDHQSKAAWALVRRAALAVGDHKNVNLFTDISPSTLKPGDQAYRLSMVGFVESRNSEIPAVSQAPKQHGQAVDPVLVDDPFSKSSLNWKLRLVALQEFLDFYALFPRIIFLTAPLAYLLGGFDVIQAAPKILLAYFVPHILHAYFVTERLHHKSRLPLWVEIRETVLAWYLLFPTALSFLQTKILKTHDLSSSKKTIQTEAFDRLLAWPFGAILGLNLIGVLAGFQHLWHADGLQASSPLMYLVWALCNVILLTATFAVAEESRQIRQHIQRQQQHNVMLQLPSGRTMTGVTENFPSLTLAVCLPVQTALESGTVTGLSIFRGLKEFTFSTRVAAKDDQRIQLAILEKSKNDYQALGLLALSRDDQWPRWLPGPTADQPLPSWISTPLLETLAKVSATAGKWGWAGKLSRVASWIKYWKKAI
jgi:cellulose synthase (UDP-forming)